eukprot:1162398-Amphidinium_carterae.1
MREGVSDPVSVLDWLSRRGFPSLSDSTLRRIVDLTTVDIPLEEEDSGISTSEHLRLHLVRSLNPDFGDIETIKAMTYASESAQRADPYTELLEPDLMEDLFLRSDQSDMQSSFAANRVRQRTYESTASRVRSLTTRWRGGHPDGASGVGAPRREVPKYNSKTKSDIEDMSAWLKENGPPGLMICGDASNQRFQLGYRSQTFLRVSFSWRTRGQSECLHLALQWAWEQRERHTGEKPSWA